MKVINTVRELREALAACDSNNVGFVPTMGRCMQATARWWNVHAARTARS